MSRNYTFEELLERPEWNDWVEIKNYIPGLPEKNDLTVPPEYGYIFDKFRQLYKIYLSVTPKIDPDYTELRNLVIRYVGTSIYFLKGVVSKEMIITGYNYYSVARKLLKIAVELAKAYEMYSNEEISDEKFQELAEKVMKLEENQAVFNIDKNFPKEEGYYTSQEARNILPEQIRKPGMIIVYKTDENTVINEQFKGDSIVNWNNDDLWEILITKTYINLIDSRLTKVEDELFPLNISTFTGGGVFKKGTTESITLKWVIKKGDNIIIPDKITINDEEIENTNTSKIIGDVSISTDYTIKAELGTSIDTKSTSVIFINPSYLGIVDRNFLITEDNIKLLTEVIKNTKEYFSPDLNLNNQKICYAYPKFLGELEKITDSSGFDYINSYERSTILINEEEYYVYLLKDSTTIINFKQNYQ